MLGRKYVARRYGSTSSICKSRVNSLPRRQASKRLLNLESLESRQLLAAEPIISEFLARNDGGLRDGDGRTSDWVEIFNAGDEAVDLAGYRLTDDPTDKSKWQFPTVSLEAGQFLVVFASAQETNDYVDPAGYLHTNFSLSRSGEYIALVDLNGAVVSEYGANGEPFPEQRTNVSYGIGHSADLPGEVGYLAMSTPGEQNVSNAEVFQGIVSDTKFSADRGYYDAPFDVTITTLTPNAQIRYTTDGSEPTATHGEVFTGPITIQSSTPLRATAFADGMLPSNVDTQTYIFLDDVLRQDGAGLPETWGVFPFGSSEAPVGTDVPSNYGMDPDVVNDPRYRGTIKDDLQTLATISIVMNPEDLWDPDRGIYANPVEQGIDWERVASVEMIGLDGTTTEFQIDSGIRIHGGFGRRPAACAKHSFRLLFKGEYGASKLEYPLFGEDQVDEFDSIVLRGNYNYSWCRGDRGGEQTGKDYTMVTDAWGAVSQKEMGGLSPNSTFVHLYLNGLYWGVYVPTERPNASFQAEHRGGDKEEYDVMGHSGLIDGSQDAWRDVTRLARQSPVDYAAITQQIDMDNYIDYMILNQFGGNGDWPQNNWFASRKRSDGEKWQFHSWDTEFFFIDLEQNRIRTVPPEGPGIFYNELRNDEAFQLHFADRIHRHLFNDGVLTTGANITRLNTLVEPLDRAVVGESARWGDAWMDQVFPPRTRDGDWIPRLDELRDTYFPNRTDIVIDQYRSVGLYPEINAPEFEQHGGPVRSGYPLEISNPNQTGIVYVTNDGSDPRQPDGTISPTAFVYDGSPVSIVEQRMMKARVLDGAVWSALTEAEFTVASNVPLQITEVNFDPHAANLVDGISESNVPSDRFEFIEFTNVGETTIDLAGVRLIESTVRFKTQGVNFQFASQSLEPGEIIVVAKDRAAFQSRYGDAIRLVTGNGNGDGENENAFGGSLANAGERITLVDANGSVIEQLDYGIHDPWPSRTHGLGSSLERIGSVHDSRDPSGWQASNVFGGSPGAANVVGPEGQVVINEVLPNPIEGEAIAIELHNTTNRPIDVTQWYLSNSEEDLFKTQITESTVLAPNGYHVLDGRALGFDSVNGDEIWLVAADQNGVPLSFVDRAEFGSSLRGVSLGPGREPNELLVQLAEPTLGRPNAGPYINEVVISEVHYEPADPDGNGPLNARDFEFVELYNHTPDSVDLTGWTLTATDRFEFEDGTVIAPKSTILVIGFGSIRSTKIDTFISQYEIDPTTSIVALRMRNFLNDDNGVVLLERPGASSDAQPHVVPILLADGLAFDRTSPWPTDANGGGASLTRRAADAAGSLPGSWTASPPSPGTANLIVRQPGDSNGDGIFNSSDLVMVFRAGEYNDDIDGNSTFEEGDWNGDGDFDSSDLVVAFQAGHYVAAAGQLKGNLAAALTDHVFDERIPDRKKQAFVV